MHEAVTSPWTAMMFAWMPMMSVPIVGAIAFVILQPGQRKE
jgi:hypothetical protein